jgi:hypothetical protein
MSTAVIDREGRARFAIRLFEFCTRQPRSALTPRVGHCPLLRLASAPAFNREPHSSHLFRGCRCGRRHRQTPSSIAARATRCHRDMTDQAFIRTAWKNINAIAMPRMVFQHFRSLKCGGEKRS